MDPFVYLQAPRLCPASLNYSHTESLMVETSSSCRQGYALSSDCLLGCVYFDRGTGSANLFTTVLTTIPLSRSLLEWEAILLSPSSALEGIDPV